MAITLTTKQRFVDGDMYGTSKLEITTVAEVRALGEGVSPQIIVPAPGAGKIVQIMDWATQTFNTVAFATNTELELITDTATIQQVTDPNVLIGTVAKIVKGQPIYTDALVGADTQHIENKAVMAQISGGAATGGNAGITIHANWRVITL